MARFAGFLLYGDHLAYFAAHATPGSTLTGYGFGGNFRRQLLGSDPHEPQLILRGLVMKFPGPHFPLAKARRWPQVLTHRFDLHPCFRIHALISIDVLLCSASILTNVRSELVLRAQPLQDDETLGRQAEQAGKLSEALTHYVATLQQTTEDDIDADERLREEIIAVVQKLKPPLTICYGSCLGCYA